MVIFVVELLEHCCSHDHLVNYCTCLHSFGYLVGRGVALVSDPTLIGGERERESSAGKVSVHNLHNVEHSYCVASLTRWYKSLFVIIS